MTKTKISDLIRQCFTAWETDDEALLNQLIAEDFTFSSPNDDHINRAEYWERCWSNSEIIAGFRILNLVEDGNEAFVRYEGRLKDGSRFKNTEYFRVEGDKIVEVEVYFGRSISTDDELGGINGS